MEWFMVSNDQGDVLAVYGAALRDMADAKIAALREEFPFAAFYLHYGVYTDDDRPRVGQTISMKGVA